MNILISGATGLIGSALDRSLTQDGHTVLRLTRRPAEPRDRGWDPMGDDLDPSVLEGVDVVIHLAGEPIASGRWSAEQKRRILESRVRSTRQLRLAIEARSDRPEAFITASGMHYYGDGGDEPKLESSPSGTGFMPEVCVAWEHEGRTDATRWACVRTGLVLTPDGGALERMLLPTKLGAGGPIAGGKQWWSWITLDDIVGAYTHIALASKDEGPFNGTAPHPVRQRDFAKTLGKVLHRPSFMPLPKFGVRAMLGEMGESLLLDSIRALPDHLVSDGYTFEHTELEEALRSVLA